MTTQEELEAAKAEATASAGEKKGAHSPETIAASFQKGSDSGKIYKVLEKAKKALTLKEIEERAVKDGIKNQGRVKTVANWFANNGIASKDDKGCFSLVSKTEVVAEEVAVVEEVAEAA